MTAGPTVRVLTIEDRPASVALSQEAFGAFPAGAIPTDWPPPGMHIVGAFEDQALLGKVVGREYLSWFGGAEVPTWGLAGVAVTAEHRGRGLLTGLVEATFAEARSRGAALSTLFLTSAGIYRRFGFELVGGYGNLEVPTATLGTLAPADGIRLRRATAADGPAIHDVYTAWASAQNGPLTRTGPSFPDGPGVVVDSHSGVTLALDPDDTVVGFVSWQRGSGYDARAQIRVNDLVGLTPDATRALLRVLGSFASVTGTVRIRTSRPDAVDLALPGMPPEVAGAQHYMLRVLDLPSALEPRHFAPMLNGHVDLRVEGDGFGDLDGGWRITLEVGTARCERVSDAAGPVLTVRGLSLLYAGVGSLANLRLAGLASGGDPDRDADLDAVFAGPAFHIRDYF